MVSEYIFKSSRLGFRNWRHNDLEEFAAINSDPEVMEHFPNTLSLTETKEFINRLKKHYKDREHTYFAVEIIETRELIGFTGLAYQDYETEFNPSVDIGWRLKKTAWGKGYATEGAKRCIKYGFEELNLDRITAVCTAGNTKSEHVMKKIGMMKMGAFIHPKLNNHPEHQQCIWYQISK